MSEKRGATLRLSTEVRVALLRGAHALIDAFFENWPQMESGKPEGVVVTRLGWYLPERYAEYYTPVFYKQFGICIVVVAWKLAQEPPLPLSCVAEELAARAIGEEAKGLLAANETEAMQHFLEAYVRLPRLRALFEPAEKGRDSELEAAQPRALFFEDWLRPFSQKSLPVVHPYTWEENESTVTVGQAYRREVTREEREALATGIDVLLDNVFDDLAVLAGKRLGQLVGTTLGWCLPRRYLPQYTWPFVKRFVVCIIQVAWKLAQKSPVVLSCVAEELAMYALLEEAEQCCAVELEAGVLHPSPTSSAFSVEKLLDVFVEDTDFTLLFDGQYDGIDQTEVGQMMAMSSLRFEDVFTPFSSEPARLAHPYVTQT